MKLPIISNFFKTKADEAYLGLIVGSHAVKATIFAPPSELEATPKILGHSEQKQGITSMRGRLILDLDASLETADLVIEQVKMAAGASPPKTFLGIFGGAISNSGMMVRLTRAQKDTPISEKELGFLLQKIKEKTIPQAVSEIAQSERPTLTHLDTFLTSYKIDGRAVSSPLGLPGQTFEATLIHTFIHPEDLKAWQLFAKELGLEVLALTNSTLFWLLPLLATHAEGVLIDVGSDASEVWLFKNGKTYGSQTFALGGRVLTEEIANHLSLSFDQAEELKLKFGSGHLDSERVVQVREIINQGLAVWVTGLEVVLKNFQKKLLPVPSNFLLCGGGARLAEVKSALLAHPWNKTLTLSAFPKIEQLDEETIYQGLNQVQNLVSDFAT